MDPYTVVTQEFEDDRDYLLANKYNLAVAKSVVTAGATVCNTIYQGSVVGPTMTISWVEVFGVNFTLNIPTPGAKVTVSGDWQPLELDEGYSLDAGGGWVANLSDPNNKPGFLNVLNNYNANVHIIVGTQDQTTGDWSPIFINPSALAMAGYGAYQPSEEVHLWYGNDQNPGYIIATQATAVKKYTYLTTKPHYFHFAYDTGKWTDQSTPFRPSNIPDRLGNPIAKAILFAAAITALAKFKPDLRARMDKEGWEVSITAVSPSNIEFKVIMSRKNKHREGSTDPGKDLDTALQGCLQDGNLPKGETWKIT